MSEGLRSRGRATLDIGPLNERVPDGVMRMFRLWEVFLEDEVEFGIAGGGLHEKPHCARVMLNALMISRDMGMDARWIDAICEACVFHDSRRQDDWTDVGHGDRAAEYYRSFCSEERLTFDIRAYLAIKYHDRIDAVGERAIEEAGVGDDGLLLYRVLKDADALDRFRLGPDGLDTRYLRTREARELVGFARELVSLTVPGAADAERYLVVVDVQNDFVDGSLGTPEALGIVPRVASKIASFQGTVLYTMDTHGEDYLSSREGRMLPVPHCVRGTEGWEVPEEVFSALEARNAERFEKSSFASTALAEHLRAVGARSVELVGLCTDICVVSNALLLRATLPEAEVSVDPSCCAGTTPAMHEEALDVMRSCQVLVMTDGEGRRRAPSRTPFL